MAETHVLIVDDHALIRLALRGIIEDDPDLRLVGEATNGEDALAMVRQVDVDLVVLDLVMPGLDGLATLERLSADHPHLRVLVLTGTTNDNAAVAAAQAGACGYMVKGASAEALIHAIREVAQGREYWPPDVAASLARAVRRQNRAALDPLTPREVEVLDLLGQGLSNADIAERLCITESTARVHVHHILEKLGLDSRTQAALHARDRDTLLQ